MKPLRLMGLRAPKQRLGPRPNLPRQAQAERCGRSTSRRPLRRWGRMLLWIVILGLVGTGGLLSYRDLEPMLQAWLQIRDVSVHGNRQVTRKEILDRLALGSGATLLSIQPDRIANRLRTHPWIKDATVTRRLPHTLVIQLMERRPAAVLQTRSYPLLLDDEGHVLAIAPDAPDELLPVLLGIDPNGVVQGDASARSAAQAGVRLAAVLNGTNSSSHVAQVGGRLEVDAANPENLIAQLKGLRFQFGSTAFEEKWDRYRRVESDLHATAVTSHAAIRNELDGRGRELNPRNRERARDREIDLRYPGKVIVRERG